MSRNFVIKQTLRQFASFAGVGAITTSAHYAVLVILVEIFSANETLASTLGYVVGATISYTLNYRFTFRSGKPHQIAVARFPVIAGVGMALNSRIVFCLVNIFTFHYFVAQIVATGFVLLWNFVGNRFWTF